jgi:hypothetical protein
MVFTVAMLSRSGLRRRSVLTGAAGVAGSVTVAGLAGPLTIAALAGSATVVGLGGCSLPDRFGSGEPDTRAVADGDALRAVAADARQLAARHDAAIRQFPDQAARLTPLRDAHREHAAAIGRSLDGSAQPSTAVATPSASGSPGSGAAATLKALAALEKTAAERAAVACVQVASYHAPLVGTIAAARASHAEALS